jgi:hypothetical protein
MFLLLSLWLTLGLNTDGSIISIYSKSDNYIYELSYSVKSNTLLRSINPLSIKGEAFVSYLFYGRSGILDYSLITLRVIKYYNSSIIDYGFGLNNYVKFKFGYGVGCSLFLSIYTTKEMMSGIRFLIDTNVNIYNYKSVFLVPSISLFVNILN